MDAGLFHVLCPALFPEPGWKNETATGQGDSLMNISKLKFRVASILSSAVLLLVVSMTVSASGGAGMEQSGANIDDTASLQRGAKLYVNYCLGCHSLAYMRYNRLAEDLGLTEEQVMQNLVTTDAKFGETMSISMDPDHAKAWFGKSPPDLSLIGRSRGADWIYSYLRGFYKDPNGGWNNTVLPNASMPNVLW